MGLRVMLLHPEVSGRSCESCKEWMYDDKPGRMGLIVLRGGQHVRRLPMQNPPCQFCPKIPAGAPPIPSSAVELSEKNATAYIHYRRCKAVGRFPVDAIVERNAALILGIEEQAQAERSRIGQLDSLTLMLGYMGKK